MRHITVRTSQEFVDFCAEKNCCDKLEMYEQEKSHGDVIAWKHRHWVCHGSMSRGCDRPHYMMAELIECVPETDYHGPAYSYSFDGDDSRRVPGLYYLGGRLRCKGQIWIMTDLEVTLVPSTQRS